MERDGKNCSMLSQERIRYRLCFFLVFTGMEIVVGCEVGANDRFKAKILSNARIK